MTPIEQKFWDATRGFPYGIFPYRRQRMPIDEIRMAFKREKAATWMIAPQVLWGNFTVDFVVFARQNGKISEVIVECDGHDYHERTKEQARRDRSRDRHFVKQGIPVLRFTGSEIWADIDRCIDDVAECLQINKAPDLMVFENLPAHVQAHARAGLAREDLDWGRKALLQTVSMAVDEDGATRISFAYLNDYFGIEEHHLDDIGCDLAPYLSMKSIDTYGRIVFRFHRDVRGPQ